jgi:hypothetical protein
MCKICALAARYPRATQANSQVFDLSQLTNQLTAAVGVRSMVNPIPDQSSINTSKQSSNESS